VLSTKNSKRNSKMLNTKVDSNYLAKVVSIKEVRKHPNADRLKIAVVDYQQLITANEIKEGDVYIYFPLESCLNKDFLAYTNSFSKAELNRDQAVKGFFGNQGRVKAVKLRGVLSEGYMVKVESLVEWLSSLGKNISVNDFKVGTTFDSVGDILICEKYVPQAQIRKDRADKQKLGKQPKVKFKKLIKEQFYFHKDTKQLKRCIENISPSDLISISFKLHGTSCILANILCNRKLKWYERFLKRLGIRIEDKEYDYVFASRKVIKNVVDTGGGYYKEDVWTATGNKLKDKIAPGITLFGEIVGYLPSGKMVQKDYDYGCEPGTNEFYVYRITYTSPNGHVFEFTVPQIQRYCEKYGLKTVPYCYYGKAGKYENLRGLTLSEEDWRELLLEVLSKDYLEKNCHMCKNIVPCEGIVLTKENDVFEGFKLKSLAFYERETKALDEGETNIEDSEEPNE
jgi:tRNA-binding EMAP/Myf-like protein